METDIAYNYPYSYCPIAFEILHDPDQDGTYTAITADQTATLTISSQMTIQRDPHPNGLTYLEQWGSSPWYTDP